MYSYRPHSVENLVELLDYIDFHPETPIYLDKGENDNIAWLPMNAIINGRIRASQTYTKLMHDLYITLKLLMITEKGNCSRAFYDIRKYGYHTYMGTRNDQGIPLVAVCNRNKTWCVYYS